jgi:ABC-2 type transport system ATP-binding protein
MRSDTSDIQPAIELLAAGRSFGGNVAIDAVSLSVAPGEIVGIVGPDGAGKTTLMRLVCGALALDHGAIRINGIDVMRETARVQAAIGYMPQRFSLYPDLSLIENLRFYGDIFGVSRSEFATRAHMLLVEFNLADFEDRLAGDLSGGMKQKLALASTLIHQPATILLDEPTAGVDPVSRREFWRILYAINRRGTTIFVSTPYMDEAERAHRVAFLSNGRVVSYGTPEELKAHLRGDVVEIVCDQRALVRRLLRDDPNVHSIEVFGDTLHALVGSASDAIPRLTERLEAANVRTSQLRQIRPSLEDTFVARLIVA